MKQAKKQPKQQPKAEKAAGCKPMVNMVGATVRWISSDMMPQGTIGQVLDQRVPMRDWIIVYVDFGEYGEHWVTAKKVVVV